MAKKDKTSALRQAKAAAAERIARKIINTQMVCAKYFNGKTRHWKRRQQMIFLCGILAVFGGSSCYLFITTLQGKAYSSSAINRHVTTPIVPQPLLKHPDPRPQPIDSSLLKQFYHKLDSLRTSPTGRKAFERFEARRPGFMDSLRRITGPRPH